MKLLSWVHPKNTSSYSNLASLLLRVTFSVTMGIHGLQKIENYDKYASVFPDPLHIGSTNSLILAIAAEVGLSLTLALGLMTHLSALSMMFATFVMFAIVHAQDAWAQKEASFLYFTAYVVMFFLGGGKYSLDALCKTRRK